MLEFVSREYRSFVDFLLWLILVGSAFGGVVLGYVFQDQFSVYFLFGGILFGVISVLFLGGFIANFLILVEKVNRIEKKLNADEYKKETVPETKGETQ